MSEQKQTEPETKPVKKVQQRQPATQPCALYSFLQVVCGFLMKWLVPVHFHYPERAQLQAPFIIIGNHLSLADPVILAVLVKKQQIAFMAKAELSKAGWFKGIALKFHAIFVNRHQSDMEAMRTSLRALKNGEILGIFPEGTRYHEGLMEQQEAGAAMIALRSGVPMVPVYLSGKLRLFRPIHCYVGETIPMDDLREEGINKVTCQKLMERITARYAEMKAAVEAK